MHKPNGTMIVILSLATLMDSLGYTLLLNVLPCMVDVADSLHLMGADQFDPGVSYSILQFSFVFGATIYPPFIGALSDKLSRKSVLLMCLFIVACTYYMQACAASFWIFSLSRFMSGFSSGLRPVSIAYIADVIDDEKLRCRLVTSLSLVSAISVGLGPVLGAHLASVDRTFPFLFVFWASIFCFFLTLVFLPCSSAWTITRADEVGFVNVSGVGTKHLRVYKLLIVLGFLTYLMAMAASIVFPLSLKEVFVMDPVQAGTCSILDGPLIFAANLVFMYKSTNLSVSCKASTVASLLFCLIWFAPDAKSLVGFLTLKYITSLAGPIVFCTLSQVMVTVCPLHICGRLAGLLTCSYGAGRLMASIFVGPLFAFNPDFVYRVIAAIGLAAAFIFGVLFFELRSKFGKSEIETPLLISPAISRGPSRSVSRIYSEASLPFVFNLKE